MQKYQSYACRLNSIEEKDLILFEMSPEEKMYAVKQYNRALLNAKQDGTDVAQIILKSLIEKYPYWGDCALVFGLCLAREKQFKRAEEAFQYAVNNTLGSEQNLAIAQEAMRLVREDMKNPDLRQEAPKSTKSWTQIAAAENNTSASMKAPILVKASNRMSDFQMASDKERRDIMMRSASAGDEMASDDLRVEDVVTPADRLRLTVKVVSVILVLTVLFLLIYFGLIPLITSMKNAKENERRLDYLISKLDENKADPEVGSIIHDYASEFGIGEVPSDVTSEETTTTTVETTTETTPEVTESTALAPIINTEPEETTVENPEGTGEEDETPGEGDEVPETAAETYEE